jgi:chromosome segregation ATPase
MKIIDPREDLQALQNAMSNLSMLAASAPSFQAAIAAARQILSAMTEAEKDMERVTAQTVSTREKLDELERDFEKATKEKAGVVADITALGVNRSGLDTAYRADKMRFDTDLEQHRVNETRRIRRELATAEEDAQKKIGALDEQVADLTKRRVAAEEALSVLKARL